MTNADLIARYDGRVPRYTSYPTALHFHQAIGANTYLDWVRAIPAEAALSLYLHVPFCDRLCLYCGCHTSVVRQERPRRLYAQVLAQEIEMLASALGRTAPVTQIHWGGGTPTALPDDCLIMLMDVIRTRFAVAPEAEIAIELDPVSLTPATLKALGEMGINRASLGVQDFALDVQQAIGRMQSFEETKDAAAGLRALGVNSLNLDLIYGLPYQTRESVRKTARLALALNPDRVAVFGYAHVPWMKKHQSLMKEDALPDSLERLAQEQSIRAVLAQEGQMVPVGLDHYAKADDLMAKAVRQGRLQRGFQGYTTDEAAVLLGLGASAISALPQGYVQNEARVPAYETAITQGHFATARGVALTSQDRLRRAVINRIMCDLAVELPAPLRDEVQGLERFVKDGLVTWDGTRLCVTEAGRPFVRNVAALFDTYLAPAPASQPRHARAV